MKARNVVTFFVSLAVLLLGPDLASAKDKALRGLSEKHRVWLEDVGFLISKKEKSVFLSLVDTDERDEFVRQFWRVRYPGWDREPNPYAVRYHERLSEARQRFPLSGDERAKIWAFHGEPGERQTTECGMALWPLEIWTFRRTEALDQDLVLVFLQRNAVGPFRVWRPSEGYTAMQAFEWPNNTDVRRDLPRHTLEFLASVVREQCADLRDDVERMLDAFRTAEAQGDRIVTEAAAGPRPQARKWPKCFTGDPRLAACGLPN